MKESTSNQIGWVVIVLVGVYILANWVVVVAITVVNMKQKYRDWKKSKIEHKKKLQEDYEYKKWKKRKQLDKK